MKFKFFNWTIAIVRTPKPVFYNQGITQAMCDAYRLEMQRVKEMEGHE